jgi:hypothetical protein
MRMMGKGQMMSRGVMLLWGNASGGDVVEGDSKKFERKGETSEGVRGGPPVFLTEL